ncbi:MAG TPA: hypothetical protein VFV19_15275 [Candidatus Polarisedimenticolaceae bacterium]|nr:hypothetical protein [Candidatus Polarisedimenticolaceae bacterium]
MRGGAILAGVLFGVAGALAADLPTTPPLAVEATAIVPVDQESSLDVMGLSGQIVVSGRDERELRVVSRAAGPEGKELPVAIWQDGARLIVGPAQGQGEAPRTLRIDVPRTFNVRVVASSSDVAIDGIDGAIDLGGKELRSTIQTSGAVAADVAGGNLTVTSSHDLVLRTRGTSLTVTDNNGGVNVHASGGLVGLHNLTAAADVEAEDAKVTIDGATALIHVKASRGSVTAKGLAGGELQLTGAPLMLQDGKGDITVTSDATVEFQQMAAALHFDLYGGNVRGKDNAGILEVRLRNSELNIEGIQDGLRVQGDGIKAKIVDVGGETYVEASVSDFNIDKPTTCDLHLDRGSLTVQRAQGAVKAVVVGADVHLTDGIGSVQLDLDGGEAEVSWTSLSADKDSQIVNKSGGVTLKFPSSAACRVEAKSKYGRVDSSIATVRVLNDDKEAQGPVNNGSRPVIHVVAQQDVHILDEGSAPAAEDDDKN